MPKSTPLVYSRLFLPHPLPPEQVAALFTRLASDLTRQPVVLETRADDTGVQHLVGCAATDINQLRRLITDLVPGTIMAGLDGLVRPSMIAVGHITVKPTALPLDVEEPERVIRAVYSALGRTKQPGEAVCVQLVLGPGAPPRYVPTTVPDPAQSLWTTLTKGQLKAPNELRARIRDHAAHHRISAILRVGATAHTSDKRRRMVLEMLGALAIAKAAGVEMKLVHEDPNRIHMAPMTQRGVQHFSVPELVAFSTWPLGSKQLPGMPPAHPKMLRADSAVLSKGRVFAESLVPGDDRLLGVCAADALFHGFAMGPTGSGKTTLIHHLIEHDIKEGRALVVLDPKDQTPEYLLARMPEDRSDDVVIIDGADERTVGFNPLDAYGRDPDVVADGILAVFAKIFADGWGPRTADIYSASLRTLARTGTLDQPHTLLDLPRLWTEAAFRRRLVAEVSDDLALQTFWAWFDSMKPGQAANVLAAPMNKLRQVLLRPAAVRILGQAKPQFRLRDVFRERKIVLVPLNEGLVGPLTAELIGALVISEVWQATQERAAEKGHEKHPGFVYVDEADRFMHLPVSLADALARSRSLSVGWFLATQYWDQLPGEMKAALKSNGRTKAIYRLESDDDARTIAKLAPGLTPEDFMELGRFEIYLRAVAGGVTTPWALARTLPLSAPTSDPAERRKRSQLNYGAALIEATATTTASAAKAPPPLSPSAPIGRKRRAQ